MESDVKIKVTFEHIDDLFVKCAEHAMKDLSLTTSNRIIKQWIDKLPQYIDAFKAYKYQAIEIGGSYEHSADSFLYMQCFSSSLKSLYSVVFNIKTEDNHKAWTSLIDAYDYLSVCEAFVRKYPPIDDVHVNGLKYMIELCKSWENVFFPKSPYFNSTGMKETLGTCSVCSSDFLTCCHIEGDIYLGRYCRRIDRKIISIDHVALVERPRDKRCLITTRHDDNGFLIDFFSRERIENEKDPKPDTYQSIIFSLNQIDLD
ncbi:hypothetical protein [Yersinia frederiksenii]|uniref:hypothetical protein n=1 Tax=Yersinia frederiksenii TaxID=29484 RepID=UPI0011A96F99|nr:hypothetical protein [Yersinia frederiksenii]